MIDDIKTRIELRRWINKLRRRRRKQEKQRSLCNARQLQQSADESKVLNLFSVGSFVPFGARAKLSPKSVVLPEVFSLTRNPEQTLSKIAEVARHFRAARKPRIHLNHAHVRYLGLGAEALLAVVVNEGIRECKGVRGACVKGKKPNRDDVRALMDEVGCARIMQADREVVRVSLKSNTRVFRFFNRGQALEVNADSLDQASRTTREFSDHLDSCLRLVGRRLSDRGRSRMLSYFGEVVANAQEHSGTALWIVVGYLDEKDPLLTYKAVILSLGLTISETFTGLVDDSSARLRISRYIQMHQEGGWFSPDWREEDLTVVAALQENVSSKLSDSSPDRGQGTIDLIEFFQEVCVECAGKTAAPTMAILSGATSVLFDGRYRLRYEESQGRKVIAFNDENSLSSPPDSSVVRALAKGFLPGVMVSMAVPLVANTEEIQMAGAGS